MRLRADCTLNRQGATTPAHPHTKRRAGVVCSLRWGSERGLEAALYEQRGDQVVGRRVVVGQDD